MRHVGGTFCKPADPASRLQRCVHSPQCLVACEDALSALPQFAELRAPARATHAASAQQAWSRREGGKRKGRGKGSRVNAVVPPLTPWRVAVTRCGGRSKPAPIAKGPPDPRSTPSGVFMPRKDSAALLGKQKHTLRKRRTERMPWPSPEDVRPQQAVLRATRTGQSGMATHNARNVHGLSAADHERCAGCGSKVWLRAAGPAWLGPAPPMAMAAQMAAPSSSRL
jgi:hypothetical protein